MKNHRPKFLRGGINAVINAVSEQNEERRNIRGVDSEDDSGDKFAYPHKICHLRNDNYEKLHKPIPNAPVDIVVTCTDQKGRLIDKRTYAEAREFKTLPRKLENMWKT